VSDETVLTKEIAEQIVADRDSGAECDYSSITTDAAMVLSGFDGELTFHDLESISDEVAEIFSRYKGPWLDFPGLGSLTEKSAASLAKVPGYLGFLVLDELSEKAAELLSEKHGELYIGALDCMPESVADTLRQHPDVE